MVFGSKLGGTCGLDEPSVVGPLSGALAIKGELASDGTAWKGGGTLCGDTPAPDEIVWKGGGAFCGGPRLPELPGPELSGP